MKYTYGMFYFLSLQLDGKHALSIPEAVQKVKSPLGCSIMQEPPGIFDKSSNGCERLFRIDRCSVLVSLWAPTSL